MQTFDRLVTVYGGSGFVGRHVVRALARRGFRVRVAVRRPDLAGHLQPLGAVGQINAVQANLRYPDSVRHAAEGAEIVINCVGIMHETGRQKFDAVQARGAETVARAAAEAGAKLIHVSAIGADAEGEALYARSKAAGEAGVLRQQPGAVILRPSVIFGPEDDFFNRLAAMARMLPVLPLIGGGTTRFQPVFVGDVADAVMAAIDGKTTAGTVYELGGPAVKTFKEVVEFVLETIGRKRLLMSLPFGLAAFQAKFLQYVPGAPLTPDQVKLLKSDSVVSAGASADGRTLEGLGIGPKSIEAIAPSYLWRFRRHGQFTEQAQ
ncbi:complex I NDUFA9 subunit family protein [Phreatobacter stygius]|uniref:Complex I NDUFA9 subunit family protein n=1 Tax=Phreatobacter stygius TaxID=1940610 RepID=A0A4D7AV00_9HYPH|nr:complex I NDUFA9 subunit family protein [Phreatobacter stygius]QCI65564.1 complex I NDUFA9 subunit family protein [Phreatobacter stygius]